jgi:hypothetical protein
VTAADWVATINAALGGTPAFVDGYGLLALQAATSVEVSNYLDAAAPPGNVSFGIVGLPVVLRDTTPTTLYQPDHVPSLQGVSQPIPVPTGANVVSVEVRVTTTDNDPSSIQWGLVLSDPTNANPTAIQLAVGLPFLDGTFTPGGGGFYSYTARSYLVDLMRSPEVPNDYSAEAPRLRFDFRLPYGTEIRVWAATTSTGMASPLPQENPAFRATVMFSAR